MKLKEKGQAKGTEGAKGEDTEARWGTEVNWHWGLWLEGGEASAVSAHWMLDQSGLVGEAQEVGLRNVS